VTVEQAAVRRHGLFSLSGPAMTVLSEVDAAVLAWAARLGAAAERHPELFGVEQLASIDYFDSFPHLAHRVTAWLDEPEDGSAPESLVLTSAACYGVYFARAGGEVGELDLVTVRQTCRRQEEEYQPLRRQREFQMREVVAMGSGPAVEDFLRSGQEFVAGLAARFGVSAGFEVATDPFFRKDDPRLLHQKLFPTKQELVDDSGLAISSVNAHRNFFGERCGVRLPDGSPMFTGCVAFGLERWVDAVLRAR
jgi:hypothetical protein